MDFFVRRFLKADEENKARAPVISHFHWEAAWRTLRSVLDRLDGVVSRIEKLEAALKSLERREANQDAVEVAAEAPSKTKKKKKGGK